MAVVQETPETPTVEVDVRAVAQAPTDQADDEVLDVAGERLGDGQVYRVDVAAMATNRPERL
jgi:hypothetical protein